MSRKLLLILLVGFLEIGFAQKYEIELKVNPKPFMSKKIITKFGFSRINLTLFKIVYDDSLSFEQVKAKNLDSLKSKISFPENLRSLGIDGNVILELSLNTDGKAFNIKTISSYYKTIDESIMNSVKDFEFKIENIADIINSRLLLIVSVYVKIQMPIPVY